MLAQELLSSLPGDPVLWAVVGALLLVVGRRLFWVALVGAGFIAGMLVPVQLLDGQPLWIILIVGAVTGLVVAGIAVLLQKVAVGLAGFVVGGYVAWWLTGAYGVATQLPPWLPFVLGGVLMAFVALWLFEWALIVVSSVAGAALVLGAVELAPATASVALVALSLLGILVQLSTLRRRRRQRD